MVNSEFDNDDPVKWAEAIKAICRKERNVRLKKAIFFVNTMQRHTKGKGYAAHL